MHQTELSCGCMRDSFYATIGYVVGPSLLDRFGTIGFRCGTNLTGPLRDHQFPLWDHPYWTVLEPSVSVVGPFLLDHFGTIGFRCRTILTEPFWDHRFPLWERRYETLCIPFWTIAEVRWEDFSYANCGATCGTCLGLYRYV
jgi:hypothetical protein